MVGTRRHQNAERVFSQSSQPGEDFRGPDQLAPPEPVSVLEFVGRHLNGWSHNDVPQENRPENPNVVGGNELVAKQSAVDEQGKLRSLPIDGVIFLPVRPVPHEDGHVTEVARASWGELADPVMQVHLTTTFPSRVLDGVVPP